MLLAIIEDITGAVENRRQLDEYRNGLEALVDTRTKQLRELASKDSLTRLFNRSYLLSATRDLIRDNSEEQGFAVLFIDLDGFKLLNDSYGHRLGDELLKQVGQRLCRFGDQARLVARLGGDEFVLIVDSSDKDELSRLADAIYRAISQPFRLHERSYALTCSMGISLWPQDASEPTLLLQSADIAMYRSKSAKKLEKYTFFDRATLASSQRTAALEQALRGAVERQEFYLVLQSKFSIHSEQVLVGAEVLLKWHSAEYGDVSPAEFIPVAERAGIMPAIGNHVLTRSCHLIAQFWKRMATVSVRLR